MRNRFVFTLILAVAGLAATSSATSVTYNTSNSYFDGTPGTTSITNGGETVSFMGGAYTVGLPSNGSFASALFGNFAVTGTGTGSFSDTFTLDIVQSSPTLGGHDVTTPLVGTIDYNANSNTLTIDFANPTFVIAGVAYNLPFQYFNVPQDSPTQLRGGVASVVPEPSSLLLLGSGLFAAAGFVRRRFVS